MKWSYRRYSVDPSRICPTGVASRPEAKIRLSGKSGETFLRILIDTGHKRRPNGRASIPENAYRQIDCVRI